MSEWPVAASVPDLIGDARRDVMVAVDGKSGAGFERVVLDDEHYVLKHLHRADDWIMRATGDLGCRPVTVWRSGLLSGLPESIDHAIVGAAVDGEGWAILMRDVGPWLVPAGDDPLPLGRHLRFLDHMAELHAAFWGWTDSIGLLPPSGRYLCFADAVVECERARGFPDAVPRIAGDGWGRLPRVAPRAADVVGPLRACPDRLVAGLKTTPSTLLHGDWKLGNLASLPDGRTVLLDWALPGRGAACAELAWYLALNRRRLPVGHSKQEAIETYRSALDRHGIDTDPWWEHQLGLCLLGALVQFGWEKAFDEPEELAWWEERACDGARYLP